MAYARRLATAADDLEAWEKTTGVDPPPEIEQLGWLVSWAAGRHGGMGTGDAARRTLLEALSGGDPSTRLAAARVLANVGRPEDLDPLKEQLADPDPAVVNAAWEAMEEVIKRWGNERRTPHLSSRPPAPRQSPG